MATDSGRYVPMSLPRKWICDVMNLASRVPTVAASRTLRVRALVGARKEAKLTISWSALVIKAMALVSMRQPELRWAYMPYPWPHFYEAPYSVVTLVVEREYFGENAVFFATMLHPERLSLAAIQTKLDAYRSAPIESIGPFRRLIRNTRLPRPIRRFLLKFGMFGSGLLRARMFGTCSVNTGAFLRTSMVQTSIPITSGLFYDGVNRDGEMLAQLAFDHRVMDGCSAARALGALESVLNGEILAELRESSGHQGLRAAA